MSTVVNPWYTNVRGLLRVTVHALLIPVVVEVTVKRGTSPTSVSR